MDINTLKAKASVHRLYRELANKHTLSIHQTHRCVYMLYQRDLLPNYPEFSNLLNTKGFDAHTLAPSWHAYNVLGSVAHVKVFNLAQCKQAEYYLNDLIAMDRERFTDHC